MASRPSKNYGFTLIELSIVLVIIALIVGGVLVGRDLIEISRYRSVIREVEQLNTAISTFRIQYNALPGDFNRAGSFWPTSCSGDGDGTIDFTPNSDSCSNNEILRVWQHLSLAGLLSQNMTGILSSTAPGLTVNQNIPGSVMARSGYLLRNYSYPYSNPARHALSFAQPNTDDTRHSSKSGYHNGGGISSQGASYIDTKLDNGVPSSGKVQAANGWAGNSDSTELTGCVTSSGWPPSAPSNYSFNTTSPHCWMFFDLM